MWFEHMHLVGPVKARLLNYIKENSPEIWEDFNRADTKDYRVELSGVVDSCLKNRGLKLGLDKIIFHRDLKV